MPSIGTLTIDTSIDRDQVEKDLDQLLAKYGEYADKVGSVFDGIDDQLSQVFDRQKEEMESISSAQDAYAAGWESSGKAILSFSKELDEAIASAEESGESINATAEDLQNISNIIDYNIQTIETMAAAYKEWQQEGNKTAEMLEYTKGQVDAGREEIEKQIDAQQKLADILQETANATEQEAASFTQSSDKVSSSAKKMGNSVQGSFSDISKSSSELIKKAQDITKAFESNSKGFKVYSDGIDAANQDLTTLEGSIDSLIKRQRELESMLSDVGASAGTASKEYAKLQSEIQDTSDEIENQAKVAEELQKAIDKATASSKEYGTSIQDVKKQSEGAKDQMDAFGIIAQNVFPGAEREINLLKSALQDYKAEVASSGATSQAAGAAMSAAFSAVGTIGLAFLASKITEVIGNIIQMEAQVDDSTEKMTRALRLTEEESAQVEEGIHKLLSTGLASDASEAESALSSVMKILQLTGEEAINSAGQVLALSETYNVNIQDLISLTDEFMRNHSLTWQQAMDQIVTLFSSVPDEYGSTLQKALQYNQEFAQSGGKIQQFISGMSGAVKELGRNWDQTGQDIDTVLHRYSGEVDTSASATKIMGETIRDNITWWDSLISKINDAITALMNYSGSAQVPALANYQVGGMNGYASGTTFARAGWAWVGERGPELMHFRGGETVLSAAQSLYAAKIANVGVPGYAGGTLGSMTNRVFNEGARYYNFSVKDIRTFAAIEDRLKHERLTTRMGFVR